MAYLKDIVTKVNVDGYYPLPDAVGQLDGPSKCPSDSQCATTTPGNYTYFEVFAYVSSLRAFVCKSIDLMQADIEGSFTEEDVKIVFNVDGKTQETYFSETGKGNTSSLKSRMFYLGLYSMCLRD